MAKKKQETADAKAEDPRHARAVEAYDAAIGEYGEAVKRIQAREFDKARPILEGLAARLDGEPELAERVRSYLRLCDRKLDADPADPASPDELYHHGVYLSNRGEWEQAVQRLDEALRHEPGSPRIHYARACAWALQGKADRAVADLRQAIAVDPVIRFQAVNDPDFERIREEPAFIDIIEPSPAGA